MLGDGRTASCAEVVAGALKQHGRATLVGSQTFGKGIRQSIVKLADGGMKLTTAELELPGVAGRSPRLRYHGKGLAPHVAVNPASGGGRDFALDRAAETLMTRETPSRGARRGWRAEWRAAGDRFKGLGSDHESRTAVDRRLGAGEKQSIEAQVRRRLRALGSALANHEIRAGSGVVFEELDSRGKLVPCAVAYVNNRELLLDLTNGKLYDSGLEPYRP